MQLIYRGIFYQSTAKDLANTKEIFHAKYRGFSYQFPQTKKQKKTGVFVLKYRGSEFIKVINY